MRAGGKAKSPRAVSYCRAASPASLPHFVSLPVFLLLNRVGAEFHVSFGETSLAPKDRLDAGRDHSSWLISSLPGVEVLLQLVPGTAGALGT